MKKQAIKDTKKAKKVLAKIEQFSSYYESAKHRRPETVHLMPQDFEALGVKLGFRFSGMTLEVYA